MDEDIKGKMDKIDEQLGKMDDSIKAEPERRERRKKMILWGTFAVIAIVVIIVLCVVAGRKKPVGEAQPVAQTQQAVIEPPEEPKIDHQAIYNEQVSQFTDTLHTTLLAQYRDEMAKAQTKATGKIKTLFDGYRQRIPRFAEDLTAFTSRMKTLGKSIQDFFSSDKEHATRFAEKTFAKDVFSNEELASALDDILGDYEEDIQRARTVYYQNCETELRKFDHIAEVDSGALENLALENLSFKSNIGGKQSFFNFGVSVAAGVVGATLAAGALGKAVGISAVIPGPIDDVIAVSIALIVDQRMAKKNRAELETTYTQVLTDMEAGIVDGSETNEGFTEQTDRYQMALGDADKQEVLDNLKMKDSIQ